MSLLASSRASPGHPNLSGPCLCCRWQWWLSLLQDALDWKDAHIVGFSMGGMIATKLAAMQPSYVRTLHLLSSSGGNWQIIPTAFRSYWTLLKGMGGDKTDESRARADVKFHFSKRTRQMSVSELAREAAGRGREWHLTHARVRTRSAGWDLHPGASPRGRVHELDRD